jgi:GNAT superfamily N-acetyltransferase
VAEVVVELLTKAHDRKAFDCGKQAQNDFLKERARKHSDLNYSKTWVAVEQSSPRILGFITLSMGNVAFDNLTEETRRQLPRYPMPTIHVGQLATDHRFKGQGIGSLLLRFGAEKAIEASETVGCYAIELTADSQQAFEFYGRRGFLSLARGSMRLYQSIETLKLASLAESSC